MSIYDRKSAAARVGRSLATIKRWEDKGWLTFTLERVREEDLLEAERTARGRRGRPKGSTKKEVAVSKTSKILEEGDWPDGAIADGRVYSLECSRAMRCDMSLYDTSGNGIEDCWVPREPDMSEPPDYERMTGTIADVTRRAVHINAAQQRSGVNAWIFYPAPVEPQGAL